jgi:hypothetical protein
MDWRIAAALPTPLATDRAPDAADEPPLWPPEPEVDPAPDAAVPEPRDELAPEAVVAPFPAEPEDPPDCAPVALEPSRELCRLFPGGVVG